MRSDAVVYARKFWRIFFVMLMPEFLVDQLNAGIRYFRIH